jgi:hypothetical protein
MSPFKNLATARDELRFLTIAVSLKLLKKSAISFTYADRNKPNQSRGNRL